MGELQLEQLPRLPPGFLELQLHLDLDSRIVRAGHTGRPKHHNDVQTGVSSRVAQLQEGNVPTVKILLPLPLGEAEGQEALSIQVPSYRVVQGLPPVTLLDHPSVLTRWYHS